MALDLFFYILLAVLGVFLILKGSEWVTDSVSHVARHFSTSSVAVGLLLVSTMLSLPEIAVAVSAVLQDHPQIGLGALLGSVIVNLGLIVGVCTLIRPLRVSRVILLRDLVFMIVASIIVAALALQDGNLSQVDGFVFLLLFIPYMVNVYEQEKQLSKAEVKKEGLQMVNTLELIGKLGVGNFRIRDGLGVFVLGGLLLIVGADFFTRGLVFFAESFHLPDLVVGITLGALGPSIPNLAAAVQATRAGMEELAISETIGSNVFTLLVSIGILALVHPFTLESTSRFITLPTLLLISFTFMFFTIKGHIGRREGMVLLGMYFLSVFAEILFRL
ncbi:MAG TPA: sodium:calcium antiporter [Candidatus Norongarragalinales archaeon]|nr:sodium:calcium antiporter [Candidatus Norongarragalinales archaeon]